MSYFGEQSHLVEEPKRLPENFTLADAPELARLCQAAAEVAAANKANWSSGDRNPRMQERLKDAKENLKDAEAKLKYIIQKSGGRRYKSKRHKRTSKRHKK